MDYKQLKNHVRIDNIELLKYINKKEIEWLKKHFAFINSLLMGKTNRSETKYKNFINAIQNTKKPTNNEERIYLKFAEYINEQIKKQRIKPKDPNIAFNGMQINPAGSMPYPKSFHEKLDVDYEGESYEEWCDDWKYR